MKKGVVVGIGEVLWDIFPGGKQLGGAPANFAFHVMKQGPCSKHTRDFQLYLNL